MKVVLLSVVSVFMMSGLACGKSGPKVDKAACDRATAASSEALANLDKAVAALAVPGPADLQDMKIKGEVFTQQATDPKGKDEGAALQNQYTTAKAFADAADAATKATAAARGSNAPPIATTDVVAKAEALRAAAGGYADARDKVVEVFLGAQLKESQKVVDEMGEWAKAHAKDPNKDKLIADSQKNFDDMKATYDAAKGDVATQRHAIDQLVTATKAASDGASASAAACKPR